MLVHAKPDPLRRRDGRIRALRPNFGKGSDFSLIFTYNQSINFNFAPAQSAILTNICNKFADMAVYRYICAMMTSSAFLRRDTFHTV